MVGSRGAVSIQRDIVVDAAVIIAADAAGTMVATVSARAIFVAAVAAIVAVVIVVVAGIIGTAGTGSMTIGDRRNPHDTICSGGPTVEIVNIDRITPGGEMLEITVVTTQTTLTLADKIMAWSRRNLRSWSWLTYFGN
jgi:hypothetical protein